MVYLAFLRCLFESLPVTRKGFPQKKIPKASTFFKLENFTAAIRWIPLYNLKRSVKH